MVINDKTKLIFFYRLVLECSCKLALNKRHLTSTRITSLQTFTKASYHCIKEVRRLGLSYFHVRGSLSLFVKKETYAIVRFYGLHSLKKTCNYYVKDFFSFGTQPFTQYCITQQQFIAKENPLMCLHLVSRNTDW